MTRIRTGGRQGRGDPPFIARTRASCWERLVGLGRRDPGGVLIVLVLLWAAFAFAWEWLMVLLA